MFSGMIEVLWLSLFAAHPPVNKMPLRPGDPTMKSIQPLLPLSHPDDTPAKDPDSQRPQAPRLDGQTVYVVDAHSLIYQTFHAMSEMSGPAGQPIGALFGFIRDLIELTRSRKVDYLICAFDAKGPTFRHEEYPDYKIDREAMPDDLRPQIDAIHRWLDALGIMQVEAPGFEADDILATIAHQAVELGADCVLVTNDKDARQLISDQVRLLLVRKSRLLDREAVVDDWGIAPEQVVDMQALWGDPSDNIPGVEGIGKKTASELLQKYGSIEGIYEHIGQINGPKRRERLRAGRDLVELSRRLVRLRTDVPIAINWEEARVGPLDRDAIVELCREYGFRQIARDLLGEVVDLEPDWKTDYRTISTEDELAALASRLLSVERITVDTETTSVWPRWADIVGLSLAWSDGEACYIPIRSPLGEPQLGWSLVREQLGPVLADGAIAKGGQNLKYDLVVLRAHGQPVAGVAFDSMVADYLLEPGQRSHGLDELARRYLRHENISISDLIGKGKSQKKMDEVPLDEVGPYAAEDADVPYRLWQLLLPKLEEDELLSLFETIEMPLIEVLAEMEYTGVYVDTERLAELSREFGKRLDRLEEEIHELAGEAFNIGSPAQLRVILFDKLGLPVVKKTKTGPSTDVEVLSQLAKQHPLPAKIIEYRQFAKLKNTYVDALPKMVHPETRRVHTSFRQDVAATGRLSSTDPNLQNIPVRTAEGRAIRSAFGVCEPDWLWVAADYSQIELRVLAELSGDEALRQAFWLDQDIHRQVAAEVFETPFDQVDSEQRRRAKAINFGIIYGQSAFGLAKSLDIDKGEAAEFIESYFARFPGVASFIDEILDGCRRDGFVSTALGRRRPVEGVREAAERRSAKQLNLPERIAVNTVIQGTAADLIKRAMIDVYRALKEIRSEARMLLQIHDELIFEVPASQHEELAQLVVEKMTGVVEWSTPLKVDVKAGRNWADCDPI